PEGLAALAGAVGRESSPPWVLSDAAAWCPRLLSAGVTLQRCHDLRLVHRILRHSELVRDPAPLRAATAWDTPLDPHEPVRDTGATLFDLDAAPPAPAPCRATSRRRSPSSRASAPRSTAHRTRPACACWS